MIPHKKIYDVVCRIPEGKVATYGQIAKLIGYPNHSRYIGRVLSQLENNSNVPWHRVVNTKGKISPRGLDGCDDYQKILLEEEKIIFNDKNCIL
ncbi:MAG: MGMT family protein, partial [Proteobacteria bacterium]|nr:MGMT family protein [Pseudomonadota bacterium]